MTFAYQQARWYPAVYSLSSVPLNTAVSNKVLSLSLFALSLSLTPFSRLPFPLVSLCASSLSLGFSALLRPASRFRVRAPRIDLLRLVARANIWRTNVIGCLQYYEDT
nr:hypothetical protein Iba_chr04aCG3490 [Ipomoea batatas]